ncbi:MAG: DUF58 domain-containing protein [Candidatus Tectomicrobia bacterium]|nr:DUF58 domain-containing protein [Candidatus Tectomicrobia bacterium]
MRYLTSRNFHYLLLTCIALFFGAVLRRIELVLIAVPFVSAVLLSALLDWRPWYKMTYAISRDRLFEGDTLSVTITVEALSALPFLELVDPISDSVDLISGSNRIMTHLKKGETQEIRYDLLCIRRGRYRAGGLFVRAYNFSQMVAHAEHLNELREYIVFPKMSPIHRPFAPNHTQVYVGNYVSRAVGEGIEFGNIRTYSSGDTIKRVNWRTSARMGNLYVNEYFLERNADLVLLLDTLSNIGNKYLNTLDICARGVASIAQHYLHNKDRVGLIDYGATFRWQRPEMGVAQFYKILNKLIDSETRFSYVSRDVAEIPRRILPPQAMIIALTPLVDERIIKALTNLAARQFDLAVIVVPPHEVMREIEKGSRIVEAACRFWGLQIGIQINELRKLGLTVVEWSLKKPLDLVMYEVKQSKRRAKLNL